MIEQKRVETTGELRRAYDRIFEESPRGESPRFYRWIVSLLGVPPGTRVLDAAGGAGGFARAATEAGLGPVTLDLSGRALRRAREESAAGMLVQADGEALPFRDGAFPAVVSLGSLEHHLSPRRAAAEIRRVLGPGGVAVVMLPNSRYSGDIWRAITTGRGPDHHQPVDRFATRAEWRSLLESEGLGVRNVLRHDKFKWWKRLLPAAFAYHFVFVCARA